MPAGLAARKDQVLGIPSGHEREEMVVSLAESVLAQAPERREEFLHSVCGGDLLLLEDVSDCVRRLSQTDTGGDPAGAIVVPVFSPGTVLAGRFRIVRAIGAGGMGMVYEAIDQTLDRRVAIKCARPGHQMSLPPEARMAREVSHFNVCKVHDLHTATTPAGEVNFLSMEFVDGETLSARLKRLGPLKPGEAADIARQICAGLAQAHRQGVIHGDLKPGNIILANTAGGIRAVITDFGLAKFAVPDGSLIASHRGGTRDYMAPELLLGESATVASDVYALGILFHAMLAGRPPQWTGTATAGSRQPSSPPRSATPEGTTVTMSVNIVEKDWRRRLDEVPRSWKPVIVKCLAPVPRRRFASADAIGRLLQPRRTALRWAIAAALLLAIGIGLWRWRQLDRGPAVRLAVLPFTFEHYSGADVSAVAFDIADRLSGSRRNFTVITPLEARQNQVDTPEKARGILGATHVLKTQLTGAGAQMAAYAELVDLESGNSLRVLKSTYPVGDTAALAKALIGMVAVGLNLKSRAPQEPVADAAYPDYIRGRNLVLQNPNKAGDAIVILERAVALDPKSALPYAALASAQLQRFRNGDGRQWLDQAAASAAKAGGINPDSVPVLIASGQVDQLSGRYEQAIAGLTRAASIDPGNPAVWRTLAQAYQSAGRDGDAVATYRKAIDAERDGYQPYFFFGNYYLARGQYRQAEEMYRKTTALAPGVSAGYMNLGLALKQQGRYREAEQSLLKALSFGRSPRLLLNLGAVYYEQERYSDALSLFQESARLSAPSAIMHRNLGDAYRHLSRAKDAAAEYRAARALAEEDVTTNPRSVDARARLALLSARLGESHRASYELAQALAMDSNDATGIANAVQTLEVLNLREKALDLLQKAPRSLLEELARVPDLMELRQDPRFQQLFQKP
uniref:Serine/threonine protein kinase with TPR repeats n=1 Tax=Solibacter usitatus (strain Ellin6076) TaxID=234267 RepID=Q020E8_SOLUE